MDKATDASHMSPFTDILRADVGPFQSPGNPSAADTLGIAKRIVDPVVKGAQTFFNWMKISTEAAARAVDDRDIDAENKGISEMNAHSVQKSIATKLPLLECVEIETTDLACS